MATNNEITVELESANGPKIVYPKGTDGDEVDHAAPFGWRVDWETTPADAGLGRKASPLTRYRYRAEIESRDTLIRTGDYVVAAAVPGGTLTDRVFRVVSVAGMVNGPSSGRGVHVVAVVEPASGIDGCTPTPATVRDLEAQS